MGIEATFYNAQGVELGWVRVRSGGRNLPTMHLLLEALKLEPSESGEEGFYEGPNDTWLACYLGRVPMPEGGWVEFG